MKSTETARHSSRNIHRVIILLGSLLIVYASVFSWNSWKEEKSSQINNLQNITELAEKAIDTYFFQLKARMLGLTQDIIETDDPIVLQHAFEVVKRFKESHPELLNITFMRYDGQILFTATEPPDKTLPTLANEPSFKKFQSELRQGHPLSISQPLESPTIHEWIIPLRYVIYDLEGYPTYIISANLPIGILQNYWKGAPFTRRAALGLIRDDGFMVSRYPLPEKIELAEIYGKPRQGTLITYLKEHQFPDTGYVEGPSGLDGPDYLQAFRRLEHFPITLFVTMPLSDIRTAWWNKVKVPYSLSIILVIGGFALFNRNISRRKQWEAELLKARDEAEKAVLAKNEVLANLEDMVSSRTMALEKAMIFAEAANRVKSTFLSNMSHELRTPMNAIMGFAYLLKNDPLSARQVDYLDKLSTSARELLQLINDILDFSRIDDPVMTLEIQDFETARIVDLVCHIFVDQAKEKNVAMMIDLKNVPAMLRGDGDRLSRILHQLVGNAVKFTEKGSICLAVSILEEINNRMVLRCEVRDTGIGMTTDQLKIIFNAFEQGDGSLTRRFGGVGLGLALTKRLVEGMHGRIGVESEIGRGSVFWLEIPFQKSSASAKRINYSGPFRLLSTSMADHSPETGKAPSAIPEAEKTSVSPESNFVDAYSEDNTQVTSILNQLEDLLADNNTTAGDLFEKSRSMLTSSLGDAANQIDKQIQDFDFTEALLTLRTARRKKSPA